MQLYKIYTERPNDLDEFLSELSEKTDYTITSSFGSYNQSREYSLIIDLMVWDKLEVYQLADWIMNRNFQNSVMIVFPDNSVQEYTL
jgi:hypothetical protein